MLDENGTLNPIPHELWKDVITRGWAIMAHKEKLGCNTCQKATNGQNLFQIHIWIFIFIRKPKMVTFVVKFN